MSCTFNYDHTNTWVLIKSINYVAYYEVSVCTYDDYFYNTVSSGDVVDLPSASETTSNSANTKKGIL